VPEQSPPAPPPITFALAPPSASTPGKPTEERKPRQPTRPARPAWMTHPPTLIGGALVLVLLELLAYRALGLTGWLIANACLIVVATGGMLAWRLSGRRTTARTAPGGGVRPGTGAGARGGRPAPGGRSSGGGLLRNPFRGGGGGTSGRAGGGSPRKSSGAQPGGSRTGGGLRNPFCGPDRSGAQRRCAVRRRPFGRYTRSGGRETGGRFAWGRLRIAQPVPALRCTTGVVGSRNRRRAVRSGTLGRYARNR
jgi:hypothetical protein